MHDELIERLESATGPDRELDAAIAVAFGKCVLINGRAYQLDPQNGTAIYNPPAFTASIDAALTLVPEGWGYVIASPGVDESHPDKWCINMAQHPDDAGNLTLAATPALAIVIAALKARP